MKRLFLFLAFLTLASSCVAQYAVQTVDCAGSDMTRFFGIANNGTIAGAMRIHGDGPQRAIVYRNGVCEDLRPYLGGDNWYYSQAHGINDRGDVVGLYVDNDDVTHGFLLHDGVLLTLDYPGAVSTDARAINASGAIVGVYINPDGTGHGFLYKAGVMQPVDLQYPGIQDTVPFGINARGDISGAWDTDVTAVGHGFLMTAAGTVSFDEPLALPQTTAVTGINDREDLVGYFGTEESPGFIAFLLSEGRFTIIDAPASVAFAINNSRVVVGNTGDANGGKHGFIARPVKTIPQ